MFQSSMFKNTNLLAMSLDLQIYLFNRFDNKQLQNVLAQEFSQEA